MAGAASQAGNADSSRAPGLTSDLQGSANVHRDALLLVWQCISSFVFYVQVYAWECVIWTDCPGLDCHKFSIMSCPRNHTYNIVAAFRGMHVSPANHSYAWLPRQCEYRTVPGRTRGLSRECVLHIPSVSENATKWCDFSELPYKNGGPVSVLGRARYITLRNVVGSPTVGSTSSIRLYIYVPSHI